MTEFGHRLRELRNNAKLTQEQVGNDTGITGCTIRAYETKNTLPRIDRVVDLAKYFNVSLDYLITGKEFKDK